jgi:hypothetical protein
MDAIHQPDDAKAAALQHVQEVIRSAETELTGLLRERNIVMSRISAIKRLLTAVTGLVGDSVLDDELRSLLGKKTPRGERGFTSACRKVLLQSDRPLSIRDCSAGLQRYFPDLAARHKNLTASIRTVLGRLVEAGQARRINNENSERAWEWIGEREEHPATIPVLNAPLQSATDVAQDRLVAADA